MILIEHKSLRFIVQFDPSVDETSCILRLSNDQRTQKFIHLRVSLMEWAMLEVTTGWLDRQEVLSTKKYASRTAHRPTVNYYRTWKHVATQFLLAKYQPATCSALVLCQNRFLTKQSVTVTTDKGVTSKFADRSTSTARIVDFSQSERAAVRFVSRDAVDSRCFALVVRRIGVSALQITLNVVESMFTQPYAE